ncbi:hypothetical protein MTR_1g052595 [Medicago truncatula]|uniref:Uncharacterized protein n=1 Tax=Medicago truncatula TaxID=3880 RepID=A0A072VIZ8_MEDTR|nr:hypothetical protein MTR_1g052595 [Medicago truncatula]
MSLGLCSFPRLRKTNLSTLFCSELGFHDVKNLSYDQITTQRSAQSYTLSRVRKTNLCTPLCNELDLGSFMKVVYMGVIFPLDLV